MSKIKFVSRESETQPIRSRSETERQTDIETCDSIKVFGVRTLKNMKLVREIEMIDFRKKTVLLVLLVSIGYA